MLKLKTKWLSRWAKKNRISDNSLLQAIENLELNLSSVSLGGGLFKVRVALSNSGKSSGFRTLIVYKEKSRAIIVYGFAKNEKENLTSSELQVFKALSKDILKQSTKDLEIAVKHNIFIPIKGDLK